MTGVGGLGEKDEGIKTYKLAVTKQSWGCTGNIANNIVITMRGASWVLGEHFEKCIII